jgi:hypothetical protein
LGVERLVLSLLSNARPATAEKVEVSRFSTLAARKIPIPTDGGNSADAVDALVVIEVL